MAVEKKYPSFQSERSSYEPHLPRLLRDLEYLEALEDQKNQAPPAIQALFPKTGGQPLVRFQKGKKRGNSPMKVGVVLSGGQAAGGHNVICGLFDALKKMAPASRLFGFLGGPSGIIENQYRELDRDFLAPYRNTGGFDMIGSGRTKIETPEQLEASLKTCRTLDLDGLVIIGGDDSNTNAALLAEFFFTQGVKTHVIGVPKTIDGDLKSPLIETSFGFDTATKIYSEMIGNICRDALSAKKYTHFIKLMGRSASHIALECALQTQPNLTLIGEEVAASKMTLKQLTEKICLCVSKRAEQGKNYGVFLIPEGLIEFVPEMRTLIQELNGLMAQGGADVRQKLSKESAETFNYLSKEIQEQLLLDRDPHGNVQVSHIATEQLLIHTVKKALQNQPGYKGKFTPVGHFFGYEGRCGYPSNFDANYCYALGFTAIALIASGLNGYMSALQKLTEHPEEWVAIGIPITTLMDMEERKGKIKPVIKKALVDLNGGPFSYFASHREKWAMQDAYCFPGPIQFAGSSACCDATTFTLQLDNQAKVVI